MVGDSVGELELESEELQGDMISAEKMLEQDHKVDQHPESTVGHDVVARSTPPPKKSLDGTAENGTTANGSDAPGTLEFFERKVGLLSRHSSLKFVDSNIPPSSATIPWLKEWQTENNKTCVRVEPAEDPVPMIVVMSNRRSGTHLTMDMLHNVFLADKLVYKANHVSADSGSLTTSLGCTCRNWLFKRAKIVHVHRNLLDVVISYFYYRRAYARNWVRKNKDVEEHWDRYSHGLDNMLFQTIETWVKTVHSYFTQPGVFHLRFEDLVQRDPGMIQKLSEFLGMKSVSGKAFRKNKWRAVSHPVQKGKGKGAKGFVELMDERAKQLVIDTALNDPVWNRDTMLDCADHKDDFVPDHICVEENGQRSLIQTRHGCEVLPRRGNVTQTLPRGYICVPDACPKDFRKGVFFVDRNGNETSWFKNTFLSKEEILEGKGNQSVSL
jgi:hypothetical protein